jgi:ABC-2 type transport system ATP-binding protein
MIREMAKNKTIILSTHNLEEVDAVCTRVIIIADGKIVVDDTPENLKTRSSLHGAVCVKLQDTAGDALVPSLEQIPGVRSVTTLDQTETHIAIRIYPKDPEDSIADQILRHLADRHIEVASVVVEEGRLDEVFRMVTASATGVTL